VPRFKKGKAVKRVGRSRMRDITTPEKVIRHSTNQKYQRPTGGRRWVKGSLSGQHKRFTSPSQTQRPFLQRKGESSPEWDTQYLKYRPGKRCKGGCLHGLSWQKHQLVHVGEGGGKTSNCTTPIFQIKQGEALRGGQKRYGDAKSLDTPPRGKRGRRELRKDFL